jgi:16S rRNA (uracil1498-N3)-methyltransferase
MNGSIARMVRKPEDALPRFLAPDLDPQASEVTLPVDEARHATHVLRLGPGQPIAVFDGRGNEFVARIVTARRDEVKGTLVNRIVPAAESAVPFTLAQAVLKASAMDDVVRDATMMGAAVIQPLVTAHIAARPRSDAVERWQRIAVASAKQCRRATVPPILTPCAFDSWLAANDRVLTLIFIEPSAATEVRSLRGFVGTPAPANAALVVGPEGGWAAEEVSAAVTARCVPVTLGQLTLRADAVPIAAISMFRFLWE